jgi:hypothetical protein
MRPLVVVLAAGECADAGGKLYARQPSMIEANSTSSVSRSS